MCYFNEQFTSGTYNPPTMVTFLPNGGFIPQEKHCIKVPLTIAPTLMKMVIGKDGYYFNGITKASHTDYIWYKKEENVVEVWGSPSNLEDAKKRLTDRMNSIAAKLASSLENTCNDDVALGQEVKCIKVPITVEPSLMSQVIGKEGCHFNSIKKASNTTSIWCKREENVIEVWGTPSNLEDAKQMLLDRMNEVSAKIVKPDNNEHEQELTCIKVPLTVHSSLMSQVIGKEGCHFNSIKKASNTTSIWCKRGENVIEVWGPPANVEDAKQMLINRMNHVLTVN